MESDIENSWGGIHILHITRRFSSFRLRPYIIKGETLLYGFLMLVRVTTGGKVRGWGFMFRMYQFIVCFRSLRGFRLSVSSIETTHVPTIFHMDRGYSAGREVQDPCTRQLIFFCKMRAVTMHIRLPQPGEQQKICPFKFDRIFWRFFDS